MAKLKNLNELVRRGRRIQGRWDLDARHRLTYRREDDEEDLKLEAALVAAEPEALVVSWTEKQAGGRTLTSLARLNGTWRANEANQLEFEVARESGTHDVLTFRGAWKMGKSQNIIYSYRRQALKTRTTVLETLSFTGWWDLTEKKRLVYTLQGSSNSAFRFRGAFQTSSILAKKGEIRYQLGAEVSGKTRLQTFTLFGKWKLSDRFELSFEMEYADGRKREIRFGAEFALTKDYAISILLMNQQGEPLGLEIILTKDFMQGRAQAFMRLKKSLEESALEAGVAIPW